MPYSPNDAACSHMVGFERSSPFMPSRTRSIATRCPRAKRMILAALLSDTNADAPSAAYRAMCMIKLYRRSMKGSKGRLFVDYTAVR